MITSGRTVGLVARLLVIGCVLGCVAWSSSLLWLLRNDNASESNAVAYRIMSGDAFQLAKGHVLSSLVDEYETKAVCIPLEARAAVTIRVRLFEDAVSNSKIQEIDEHRNALIASIKKGLRCTPTDGFLWFVRYWTEVSGGGGVDAHFEELRMSYLLAPLEAWIAARRNSFALAIYEVLPPDLMEYTVNEYVALVDAGFTARAVQNLTGPGWPVRDVLLSRLGAARLESRLALNRALLAEGIGVDIPGVDRTDRRPWR